MCIDVVCGAEVRVYRTVSGCSSIRSPRCRQAVGGDTSILPRIIGITTCYNNRVRNEVRSAGGLWRPIAGFVSVFTLDLLSHQFADWFRSWHYVREALFL